MYRPARLSAADAAIADWSEPAERLASHPPNALFDCALLVGVLAITAVGALTSVPADGRGGSDKAHSMSILLDRQADEASHLALPVHRVSFRGQDQGVGCVAS